MRLPGTRAGTIPTAARGPSGMRSPEAVRARPVGFEIARCAVVMLDRMASFETDIHDVVSETWEVGSSNGMEGDLR